MICKYGHAKEKSGRCITCTELKYGKLPDRFWVRVNKDGPVIISSLGPCWEYLGSHNKGYAYLRGPNGTEIYGHEYTYELLIGPIPSSLQPDHLCSNRGCVNPWHIEYVTQKVNILRGTGVTALNARKIQCKNGHLLEGDNLYIDKRNQRICRICHRNYENNRRLKGNA